MVEEMPSREPPGAPIDPMRLAMALWQRRSAIAITAIVGLATGATVAKTIVPAVFEARSVIECDRCSGPDFGDRELATLQESVKLPHHLENARQKLSISTTLEELGRDVEVSASIESRIIQVTTRGESGSEAAELANTVVHSFLETRLEVERDKLVSRARTLRADAEKARLAVSDAQSQYDRFRVDNNIADLSAEREAAIQEAARLRSEAGIARAEAQSEQARASALRLATSKEPLTTVQKQEEEMFDAKRLAEARSELVKERSRFSDDHPSVLALAAEIETLERKVAQASEFVLTRRTVESNPQLVSAKQEIMNASAAQKAADMRQSMYETLAQRAAQAAARLSDIEGRASELLSNLQNAEGHWAAIERNLMAAEDAARDPSTGLHILAEASPPVVPIKSSRRIVALAGPFLGAIIASIFVMWRELRGIRVFTATELAFWGKGPVVASVRWPRAPESLDDLATELGQPLQSSSGTTLLVGVSQYEVSYLDELKNALHAQGAHALEVNKTHSSGPVLRRAAREADRVLVAVAAGKHSALSLRAFVEKLALPGRIGFVLMDARDEHGFLPDLVGNSETFWSACHSNSPPRTRRPHRLFRTNTSPTNRRARAQGANRLAARFAW